MRHVHALALCATLAAPILGGSCSAVISGSQGVAPPPSVVDLADPSDLTVGPPNACGDHDPSCTGFGVGPPATPFPLSGDPKADPSETDLGLDRDANGALVLGSTHAQFDFIYTANTDDWNRGTVSKINSKTVKEVARYPSVTCYSNAGGSKANCDGTNGCCARDDNNRYVNRKMGKPPGPAQAVQLMANFPSRTAVDFNGDMWVANRAFGGQSSVTKIANDTSECSERNGVPGIQTSSDVNGDGIIDTDCNRNQTPDDLDDVKAKGCLNGKPQEYYGVDDECVLFTTNTNVNNQWGRPLALGTGAEEFGASDAWAGTFNDGKFFRIDSTSGEIKADGQVGNYPYGAAIDGNGVLWAPGVATGVLCYLDTTNPAQSGCARGNNQQFGYGIGLDRDQNVWVGGYAGPNAYRYSPDRSNGFGNLGKGFWTTVQNPGQANGAGGCQGRGIAADSRQPNQYWVWMACNGAPYVVRIDGMIPVPKMADVTVDGSHYLAVQVAGNTICGVGIDVEQNVWGVASGGAIATRIKVDAMGNPTAPSIAGNPGNGCPVGAGDYCATAMTGVDASTTSYTYSDFTGFGLRNFTLPKGSYSYLVPGCKDGTGAPADTHWVSAVWDADVPANTTLAVRARTGEVAKPDNSWGAFTPSLSPSPAALDGKVMPQPAKFLQIEFDFSTMDRASSPRLKSFKVLYECPTQPG